jgi:putative restriction endonuclease
MALPFFHLRNERFWDLVPKPGKEEALNVSAQIRSLIQLRESVLGARLEESLYRLLHDAELRGLLRSVLLEVYFAPEARDTLAEQSVVNREAELYSEKLLDGGGEAAVREATGGQIPIVRRRGIRVSGVRWLRHTIIVALCAVLVCGLWRDIQRWTQST